MDSFEMTTYNDEISQYINGLFCKPDVALEQTIQSIQEHNMPTINVKPEEGCFLQFLVRACNARRVLEIGTLGGYSGIWIARGLPPGGKLTTVELEPLHAQVSQANFARAKVDDLVQIQIGNAHDILPTLESEGPFDLVFIDAEKPGYPKYFDWAVENIRLGGVIAAHNAFRKGEVLQKDSQDERVQIMQAFNQQVARDARFIATIYPAGDGMVLAVKVSD